MAIFHEVCPYKDYLSCSKDPVLIQVKESSKSLCTNKLANITFTLPSHLGKPKTFFCESPMCINGREFPSNEIIKIEPSRYSLEVDDQWPRYFFVSGSNCRDEVCRLTYNESLWDNCRNASTSNSDLFSSPLNVGMTVFGCFVIALLIIALVAYFRQKKIREAKKRFYSSLNLPLDVFLVYHGDHPKHTDIILKFATLLKQDFGINVRMDLYEREKIYGNPAGWLDEVMTSCEKILIIWSPGAETKWKNHERTTDRFDMFTPVLRQLNHDLIMRTNVDKYLYAYFDYCKQTDIPLPFRNRKMPEFQLLKQLHNLLLRLANKSFAHRSSIASGFVIKKTCVDGLYAVLEQTINEMQLFTQQNHKWYETKSSNNQFKQNKLVVENEITYNNSSLDPPHENNSSAVWNFISNDTTLTSDEKTN